TSTRTETTMEGLSIFELQAQMQAGKLSARTLVGQYLARIDTLDRHGPALNAVIETNPDALAIADALDVERAAQGPRGPLHGIPVILKDNIDTADRMMTTAGSLALLGSIAPEDAFLVQKLRQAGAVILGKSNLSEWANFRSPHSSSGWSSRGGQTRNPYALDRNPCGSSSGSAVAVAANLCSVAIGTETDGSIICPSHTNGIVGIKPTLGLVSRTGIIPVAHSQDTAGPMARTVADAAILLGALTGVDPHDPATEAGRDHALTDTTPLLDPDGMRGARIGVARNFFGFNPRVDAVMETCIRTMRDLGATIVDPADVITADDLGKTEIEVLLYELKADLNAYLARLGPGVPVHSLEEIIAFNEAHKESVMPYFGQERMIAAQAKGPLTDAAYVEALATNHRLARAEGIDATLRAHNLDAIIAPSGGPACLTDWVKGDHHSGGSSSPAAVAGYPNITVPAGYIFGLPVGLSFFAGAYQEPTLIKLAYAFELATRVRRPPQFLPSVDFGA
ncbi:MAG: amidase, partial [Anaerolineae bacterium]|nr:amidase [Anaerolineae bacterium]